MPVISDSSSQGSGCFYVLLESIVHPAFSDSLNSPDNLYEKAVFCKETFVEIVFDHVEYKKFLPVPNGFIKERIEFDILKFLL